MIIDDRDYDYCYQNLILETHEWYNALKLIKNHYNAPAPKLQQMS